MLTSFTNPPTLALRPGEASRQALSTLTLSPKRHPVLGVALLLTHTGPM